LVVHPVAGGDAGHGFEDAIAVAVVGVGDSVGLNQVILEVVDVAIAIRRRGVPFGIVRVRRQLIVGVVV